MKMYLRTIAQHGRANNIFDDLKKLTKTSMIYIILSITINTLDTKLLLYHRCNNYMKYNKGHIVVL